MNMNAVERRNHLVGLIQNLCDHVSDQAEQAANRWSVTHGPKNWRGVGDLESAVNSLCMIASQFDGKMTADEIRTAAEEMMNA